MKQASAKNIFELGVQLITALAVVVGVFLVIYELQLTREMTYAQMVQDRIGNSIQETTNVYGENVADALEKACYNPEAISRSDAIILESYFENKLWEVYRAYALVNIGKFDTENIGSNSFENMSRNYVTRVLAYESGRSYLKKHYAFGSEQAALADPVVAYVRSVANQPIVHDCKDFLDWFVS
ncbi:MAG: hypothetical protein VYD91_05705 [Pseudomonadota bacterium]|nr:hypothetical protein [Pseudomonadota bacterium]